MIVIHKSIPYGFRLLIFRLSFYTTSKYSLHFRLGLRSQISDLRSTLHINFPQHLNSSHQLPSASQLFTSTSLSISTLHINFPQHLNSSHQLPSASQLFIASNSLQNSLHSSTSLTFFTSFSWSKTSLPSSDDPSLFSSDDLTFTSDAEHFCLIHRFYSRLTRAVKVLYESE